MKKFNLCLAAFLLFAFTAAVASQGNAANEPSVAQVLNSSVTGAEKELMSAADAMPADKFTFAPSSGEFKGVRTFGEQLRHIAAVNYLLGAAILGEKVPVDTGGESGPVAIASKPEIIKYATDSFAYLHKAIDSVNEKNMLSPVKYPFGDAPSSRLALSVIAAQHIFDHYGQMVEYLRMNSIVPPASR